MEERQLILIEPDEATAEQWRLDEATRRAGREGVQQARAALREARRAAEGQRTAA